MSMWRYEFTLETPEQFTRVHVPKRMNEEVQELWVKRDIKNHVLRLHRGTEQKLYHVRFYHVFTGPGTYETFLAKGWTEFVTENSLQMQDRIRLELEDDDGMLYRVRIWRAEKEITMVDPHFIIENDGSMSDVDSSEYLQIENTYNPPSFDFTFSKGYFDKPTINIPLPFARAHFKGLKEETPIQLYVNRWWSGTMRIMRDKHNNILTCSVKKGIPQMIDGEGIKLGEKAVVELECDDPPILSLTFT